MQSGLQVHLVAHVVGGRPPGLWSWLTAILLFGGLAGALLASTRPVRIACLVVAASGLGGSIDDLVSRYQRPRAPHLRLILISPGRVASPRFPVFICARSGTGRRVRIMAGGRFLLVRVDDIQVAEVQASRVTITTTPGRHVVTAEVNNSYHQEYVPPLLVRRSVRVTMSGAAQERSCP